MTYGTVCRHALRLRRVLAVSCCLTLGACDLLDEAKEKLGLQKPADFRTEIQAMGKAMEEFRQATSDALGTAMEKTER